MIRILAVGFFVEVSGVSIKGKEERFAQ